MGSQHKQKTKQKEHLYLNNFSQTNKYLCVDRQKKKESFNYNLIHCWIVIVLEIRQDNKKTDGSDDDVNSITDLM